MFSSDLSELNNKLGLVNKHYNKKIDEMILDLGKEAALLAIRETIEGDYHKHQVPDQRPPLFR